MNGESVFGWVKVAVVIIVTLALGYAAFWLWNWIKAHGGTNLINPASDENLAYRGVNEIVRAATGDNQTTLGSKIYDWLHPNDGLADDEYLDANGIIRKRTAEPGVLDKIGNWFSSVTNFSDATEQIEDVNAEENRLATSDDLKYNRTDDSLRFNSGFVYYP